MSVRRSAAAPPWRSRIVGHADAKPADLVPNPRNWRSHPADQQRALTGALSEVGWVAEVLVNRTTGHVVDGHLRVELALARHEPTVPVTYVELSDDEERLVLATLDPLAAMATAEKDALAALLADLTPADGALATLLAELAEQHGLRRPILGDPDEVPPVPDEADVYVEPGSLWRLGDHRLLCSDATDADAVARLLAGATPTLLATDPPYGVSLDPTWRDGIYNGSCCGGRRSGACTAALPDRARSVRASGRSGLRGAGCGRSAPPATERRAGNIIPEAVRAPIGVGCAQPSRPDHSYFRSWAPQARALDASLQQPQQVGDATRRSPSERHSAGRPCHRPAPRCGRSP